MPTNTDTLRMAVLSALLSVLAGLLAAIDIASSGFREVTMVGAQAVICFSGVTMLLLAAREVRHSVCCAVVTIESVILGVWGVLRSGDAAMPVVIVVGVAVFMFAHFTRNFVCLAVHHVVWVGLVVYKIIIGVEKEDGDAPGWGFSIPPLVGVVFMSVVVVGKRGVAAKTCQVAPQEQPECEQKMVTKISKKKRMAWRRGAMIGHGAFGVVHIGMNTVTGELMAVKTIPFALSDSDIRKNVSKMQNEIHLMRSLHHPNVVQYYSCERDGERLNVFMEYVPGGSLAALCQQFGALSIQTTCYYTKQILCGLQYLHSKEVIHRDIKGANILLTVDGDCKLADFGAAAFVDKLARRRNSLQGTPLWMAPEVITQQEYSETVDIWSMGCTVLEMITGEAPFTHKSDNQLLLVKIIIDEEEELPLPDVLNTDEKLRHFVTTCLQREPASRPSATKLLTHPFLIIANDSSYNLQMRNTAIAASYISDHSKAFLTIYYVKWARWTVSRRKKSNVMLRKVEQMTRLMFSMCAYGIRLIYFTKWKLYRQQRAKDHLEALLAHGNTRRVEESGLRHLNTERSFREMQAFFISNAMPVVTSLQSPARGRRILDNISYASVTSRSTLGVSTLTPTSTLSQRSPLSPRLTNTLSVSFNNLNRDDPPFTRTTPSHKEAS